MNNSKAVSLSILIAILLTIRCADVLAHGEGQCITDPSGNVFLRDGSWVKITGHLKGEKLNIKGLD